MENLKSRRQKLQATTATINTIASNEVLNRVEALVLLELHERISIPCLLNNAETWILNKTETAELEKIEIQALKNIYQLPIRTPNTAVMFLFGTLFTKQRVDRCQLFYLHKILNRPTNHWTTKMLISLEEKNIGWSKHIKDVLTQYNLTIIFQEIKVTPWLEWRKKVNTAIETKHLERLNSECYKTTNGVMIVKTKTSSILTEITKSDYKRQPHYSILRTSKQEARNIIFARYGLLECGRNFKGTHSEICSLCKCIDDESHRLNECKKYKEINLYDVPEKVDFSLVYSNDLSIIRKVTPYIERVWNTHSSHGMMANSNANL